MKRIKYLKLNSINVIKGKALLSSGSENSNVMSIPLLNLTPTSDSIVGYIGNDDYPQHDPKVPPSLVQPEREPVIDEEEHETEVVPEVEGENSDLDDTLQTSNVAAMYSSEPLREVVAVADDPYHDLPKQEIPGVIKPYPGSTYPYKPMALPVTLDGVLNTSAHTISGLNTNIIKVDEDGILSNVNSFIVKTPLVYFPLDYLGWGDWVVIPDEEDDDPSSQIPVVITGDPMVPPSGADNDASGDGDDSGNGESGDSGDDNGDNGGETPSNETEPLDANFVPFSSETDAGNALEMSEIIVNALYKINNESTFILKTSKPIAAIDYKYLIPYQLQFGKIQLPDSIKFLQNNSFSDLDLYELNLPKELVIIGDGACCYNMHAYIPDLPKNLQYIGASAFTYATFQNLTFYTGITIGLEAFTNCLVLGSLTIPKAWSGTSIETQLLNRIICQVAVYDDGTPIRFFKQYDYLRQEQGNIWAITERYNSYYETTNLVLMRGIFNTDKYGGRSKRVISILIPNYITAINDQCFYKYNGGQIIVRIPYSVSFISEYAFYQAQGIDSYEVEENVSGRWIVYDNNPQGWDNLISNFQNNHGSTSMRSDVFDDGYPTSPSQEEPPAQEWEP